MSARPDPTSRRWHRPGSARSGASGLLALSLVLLVALATPIARPTGASAQVPVAPGEMAGGPAPLDPTVLRVEDVTTILAPVDTLSLGLRFDGAPEGSTLELRLRNRVTAGRIRLHETMAGDGLGSTVRAYPDLPVADLPRDDSGLVRIDLPLVDSGTPPLAGFRLDRAGIYPLELTLDDADGALVDRVVLHLVRLPADDGTASTPLAVATTVPLEAPLTVRPDGSDALDERSRAALERTVTALANQPDVPLTVAPNPETLEALAAHDAAAGSDLVGQLADVLPGRQVVARPWVPLATSSWRVAGDVEELPTQLVAGIATATELLGTTPRRGTWLLDLTIDPATLTQLRDLGVDQVVIPDGQLSPLPETFDRTLTRSFVVRDGAGVPVPAMGADARLQAELVAGDQPALAANRVLADLALLHLDEEDSRRGVVLAVPGGTAMPGSVPAVLNGLAVASDPPPGAAPVLDPVTLDTLFASVEAADDDGGVVDPTEDDVPLERSFAASPPVPLGTLPADIDRGEDLVASYRTMLPSGDDATAQRADRLLLAAADRDAPGDIRQGLLDAVVTIVDTRTSAITTPDQGSVTLTASEGAIPVVIDNGLDVPMRVRLRFTAEKVDLPDGDELEVELAPGTNRIEVRVRARASGAFPVAIDVTSPDGQLPLTTTRVQVRSTAVSGLGVVLSVAAGAFLAVWWALNLRSSRRRRSLVAGTHPTRPRDAGPDDRP